MSTNDDPAVAAHDACEPEQDACPTCGRSAVSDAKKNRHPSDDPLVTWFDRIVVNPLLVMLVILAPISFAKCLGYHLNIEVQGPVTIQPEPTSKPAPVWTSVPAPEPAQPICLPMSRKLLSRHFDQVYPEDYIQKKAPDFTKPYVGCFPETLRPSRTNKNHYDVWECQVCIPPGAVLDLPP